MKNKVIVLGAGSWGVALSDVLVNKGYEVFTWHYDPQKIKALNQNHFHNKLNCSINKKIYFFSNFDEIDNLSPIVLALPSYSIYEVFSSLKGLENNLIISASKGFVESESTISSMLTDKMKIDSKKIVSLTGPSHAEEVIKKKPTSVVASSESIENAKIVQNIFSCDYFRVYTNNDILGSEIGGAVKNVIAIAAGICNSFEVGDNAIAALVTRGLEEIKRLGVELGAQKETFSGLSGLGDLVATCFSDFSRNKRCGELIAKGYSINDIRSKIGMEIEGISTSEKLFLLSKRFKIEMPIITEVYKIIYEGKDPQKSIQGLMSRSLSREIV